MEAHTALLKHLLDNLPPQLPLGSSDEYPLEVPLKDLEKPRVKEIHEAEGLPAAVSKCLKDIFGWDSPRAAEEAVVSYGVVRVNSEEDVWGDDT